MQKFLFFLIIILPGISQAQLAGNSLRVNADANYVSIPDATSTSLNTNMTIEAWIYYRCENGTSNNTYISKGWCGSTWSYQIGIWNRKVRFSKWKNLAWSTVNSSSYSNVVYETNDQEVPFNTWTHIAVSINGTSVIFYINGQAVSNTLTSGTDAPGFKPSTEPIRIGVSRSLAGALPAIQANIDDVRIWHKAKTVAEIQAEMNIELTGNETDLFAYWKLNETGTGASISVTNSAIATGSTYNGTTVGTAANVLFVNNNLVLNTLPVCGPILWLKADEGVTYNANNEVSNWTDYGDLGMDASMLTPSNKPKLKTNEINNKPVIRFDGLDDYMNTPSVNLITENKAEIFYVAKSRNEGIVLLHGVPGNSNVFSLIENSTSGTNGHSTSLNGILPSEATCKTVATDSCYHTMNVRFDKALTGLSQVQMYRNQVLLSNVNGTITGPEITNNLGNSPFYIGGISTSGNPFIDADIAEIIVYNKILTTAERAVIYNYLNSKYFSNHITTQFSVIALNTIHSDAVTDDDLWRHSYNASQPNQVISSIKSNCLTFDQRSDTVYIETNAVNYSGGYFMRRHYVVQPQTEYPGTKTVRLYYSVADFNDLQNFVPSLLNHAQLAVTQYDGLKEDGIYDPSGGNINLISPSQITNGIASSMYYLEFEVTHFSEFWISVGNFALPIHDLKLHVKSNNGIHHLSWICQGDCDEVLDYSILESSDGKNFTSIRQIPSNSNDKEYSTSIGASSSPKQYFMIEAIDIENKTHRSNVYLVKNLNDLDLQVNQSPSSVSITTNSDQAFITVYNLYGQKILSGKNNIVINKQNLAQGLYIATIMEQGVLQRSIKFEVD